MYIFTIIQLSYVRSAEMVQYNFTIQSLSTCVHLHHPMSASQSYVRSALSVEYSFSTQNKLVIIHPCTPSPSYVSISINLRQVNIQYSVQLLCNKQTFLSPSGCCITPCHFQTMHLRHNHMVTDRYNCSTSNHTLLCSWRFFILNTQSMMLVMWAFKYL